ncbi:MAG TPA: hypothetical protein PLV68_00885, partial [Ilumatobacteraceae bacterium]|nr:hypothetical protein [Ilumatobacteraceae bacterium]
MTSARFDVVVIAQSAADRLGVVARRARVLARGALLFALAGGVLAYAVGWFAFPSSWHAAWGIVGLVICAVPGLIVWLAIRRVRRVSATLPATAVELQAALNDPRLRESVYNLVERDGDHEERTPLIKLGKELNELRTAADAHRATLTNAWASITSLTSLPGLVALATLGTIALVTPL